MQQTQQNRYKIKYYDIPKPPFLGSKIIEGIPLEEVFKYLNLTALIKGQWQIHKGDKSDQEYKKFLKEEIYPELEKLKKQCIVENLFEPKVVYGYYLCNSMNEELIVYRIPEETAIEKIDKQKLTERVRFKFPRQTTDRFLCLSDYFAPIESNLIDICAFQIVTVGNRASEYSEFLFKNNHYKEYLYFHGLSVETAEALAEMWHKEIRYELNIHNSDADDVKKLFSKHYRGARYSFGYPACPKLEDQKKIFELLQPERIGVELTEEYQLIPEQSTSAIIVHHPEARYFSV